MASLMILNLSQAQSQHNKPDQRNSARTSARTESHQRVQQQTPPATLTISPSSKDTPEDKSTTIELKLAQAKICEGSNKTAINALKNVNKNYISSTTLHLSSDEAQSQGKYNGFKTASVSSLNSDGQEKKNRVKYHYKSNSSK